jgi:hypothetical protein
VAEPFDIQAQKLALLGRLGGVAAAPAFGKGDEEEARRKNETLTGRTKEQVDKEKKQRTELINFRTTKMRREQLRTTAFYARRTATDIIEEALDMWFRANKG